MDGEFPDHCKCPVCFEIPEKEIYQCENGHTICNNCVKGLLVCPQCNMQYGTKHIRNRALEELLDMMKFNCSFKSNGCNTKVTRHEISSHYHNCKFGGEQAPFCKYLGYTCNFKVKSLNLHESLDHLKQEHSILSKDDCILNIKIPNFKNIDKRINGFWSPILLNIHSSHFILVAQWIKGNFSFACIWIGGNKNSNVDSKFRITNKYHRLPPLEWATKPISLSNCKPVLQFPPLLVSHESLIYNCIQNDILSVEVNLIDKTSLNIGPKQVVVNLDSFMVLPSTHLNKPDKPLICIEDIIAVLLTEFGESNSDVNRCNACGITPIKGPTYKCLQCIHYELCSACMAKNEHSFHHFTFLCGFNQVLAMDNVVKRSSLLKPFVECGNNDNSAAGYTHGSIYSDVENLRCQKCENPPDLICLQCRGPQGFCGFCFMEEFKRHSKSHFFVITMTKSARQFALHVLRKHNILSFLKHEIQR